MVAAFSSNRITQHHSLPSLFSLHFKECSDFGNKPIVSNLFEILQHAPFKKVYGQESITAKEDGSTCLVVLGK